MRDFMCPGVEIRMQRVENKHNKRNAGYWGAFFLGHLAETNKKVWPKQQFFCRFNALLRPYWVI